MMGPKQEAQAALFYEFSIEGHCPSSEFSGMLRLYRNGGSGSVSV